MGVNEERLKDSINYKQIERGHAYPLFYDTLFHDIRDYLTEMTLDAKSSSRGVWSADESTNGFSWNAPETLPPIFPKLWRRIDTYSRDDTFFEAALLPVVRLSAVDGQHAQVQMFAVLIYCL